MAAPTARAFGLRTLLTVGALIIAAAAVPASASSGPSEGASNGSRIIGGSAASAGQFPWQVYLFSVSAGRQFCGGSLVTLEIVVTAAHCIDPNSIPVPVSDVRVVAGTTRVDAGGVVRSISGTFVHPAWDPSTSRNDMAVLFLSSPLPSSATIRTIEPAWPGLEHLYDPGESVRVSGWGRTASGPPPGSGSVDLRFVDVPVVNSSTCARIWSDETSIAAGEVVCTGSPQAAPTPCQGDSGGPLSAFDSSRNKWFLIGVVSFGLGTCETFRPAVYTKVASYLGFIDQNVGATLPRVEFAASSGCGTLRALPALRLGPPVTVEVSASAPPGEAVQLSGAGLPAWASLAPTPGNPARGTLTLAPGLFEWLFGLFGPPTVLRVIASAPTADANCDVPVRVNLF